MMKKILIVDDEEDILEFLSYNFRRRLFEVHIAHDGVEGLAKANEIMPDIIISDLLMPKMNGIEMCTELRKNSKFAHVPIIFLSAVNDDYKVLHAFSSGGNEYFSKPVRFPYLLNMVNRLFEKRMKMFIRPA